MNPPRDNPDASRMLGYLSRLSPLRFPQKSDLDLDPVEALAQYVHERRLDRVSARAAWLFCEGKLDPRDLREFLPKGIVVSNQVFESAVDKSDKPSPKPGDTVHRYPLGRQIGAGGNGTVFLSRHPSFGLRVAVKVVADSHRANAEVEALTAICHSNVIRLWDTGRSIFGRYLVLSYASGGSVQDLLKAGQPLPPRLVFRIARHTIRGLAATWSAGFVHGDVKPGNVLRSGRTFTVSDFGLAQRRDGSGTRADRVYGSWGYLAPERFDQQGDHLADVYSLGLTLYHLLTGHPPVQAESFAAALREHRKLKLEPLHWTIPGVSREQSSAIRQMTARDPAERPKQLLDLLAAFRGGTNRVRESE